MLTYEPGLGEHIHHAADEAAQMARDSEESVAMTLNGIELTCEPGTPVCEVENAYTVEMNRRAEEYRKSTAWIAANTARLNRIADADATLIFALQKLPSLDFSNLPSVLAWICSIQDATDTVGTVKHSETILWAFQQHGYIPGECAGKSFDATNCQNFARYIIGHALEGLQCIGAIRHIIHKFTADWHERFDYLYAEASE